VTDSDIKRDLAYAYRILSYLKLDDHTYTHLSARSCDGDSFFIYPFGSLFHEIEKDSLMKVSLDGEVIEGEEHQYNRTGYIIHGMIYQSRKDIDFIFHIHTPEITAVSSIEEGLMPLSQWALHFYDRISYHDYNSLALDHLEGKAMISNLGDNYVMLLRNHGSITTGRTVQEAMFYTYHLQQACKTQLYILSMNSKIKVPSKEVCKKSVSDLLSFEKDLGLRDWKAWIRVISPRS
jgi:ribulose-5-phosphate 4-epimerase/fuculose-1-phosphate aldolase